MTSPAFSTWTPPENPDAMTILREAQNQDLAAERYEDALAKFEWFHRNALTLDSGLHGVRLSFALASWVELAKVYPPALESLKKVRDEAVAKVKGNKPSRDAFADVGSINERLEDDAATVDLFLWLEENRPDIAKKAYFDAEEVLIRTGNYQICGPYLDPEGAYRRAVSMLEFFSDEACSLVALLVNNGRQAEAEAYAAKAAAEWPNAGFAKKLEEAKQGIIQ